jgi:hypothetical protein
VVGFAVRTAAHSHGDTGDLELDQRRPRGLFIARPWRTLHAKLRRRHIHQGRTNMISMVRIRDTLRAARRQANSYNG